MATRTDLAILESGDRLSREEFHRRYLLRPDIHKAELVGGMVFVPDAVLFSLPPRGTLARLDEKGYIVGAPDLIVEIAASSASYDLHDKKEAYRRARVPEYIVWRVLDGQIDWFRLRGDNYVRIEPDADGVIESAVFPGLRLAVDKMLAGDVAGVLAAIGVRL